MVTVGSIVEFKQIVGRGTRLYPDKGKTSFEIVDFVGATRHFEDPDFDGYPVRIIHDPPLDGGGSGEGGDVAVHEPEPPFVVHNPGDPVGSDPLSPDHDASHQSRPTFVVDEGGFSVVSESVHVVDHSSGGLRLTEYGEFVAGVVRRVAPTPGDLARQWSRRPSRDQVLTLLEEEGIAVDALLPVGEGEVDPFDFLVQLAWGLPSRTRTERARRVRERHHAELEEQSELARAVLSRLLDIYADRGIDDVSSPERLRLPEIVPLGTVREIAAAFGDPTQMHQAIDELQDWLYSDESA